MVTKVWVNGSFDVLHLGHIRLLQYAKSICTSIGHVRVGIDTDERIRSKKGTTRPYNTLADRIAFLQSIRYVDSVVAFNSDKELKSLIQDYSPNYMVIGEEYRYKTIIGIEYIPTVLYYPTIEGKSTSKILSYDKANSL